MTKMVMVYGDKQEKNAMLNKGGYSIGQSGNECRGTAGTADRGSSDCK